MQSEQESEQKRSAFCKPEHHEYMAVQRPAWRCHSHTSVHNLPTPRVIQQGWMQEENVSWSGCPCCYKKNAFPLLSGGLASPTAGAGRPFPVQGGPSKPQSKAAIQLRTAAGAFGSPRWVWEGVCWHGTGSMKQGLLCPQGRAHSIKGAAQLLPSLLHIRAHLMFESSVCCSSNAICSLANHSSFPIFIFFPYSTYEGEKYTNCIW